MNIAFVIIWWFALSIYGAASVGIAWIVCRNLSGRGLAVIRIMGLLLSTYLVWILGTAHVLPFNRASVLFSVVLLGFVTLLILSKQKEAFFKFLYEQRYYLIAAELVFFVSLFGYSWLRSWNPDIASTEKFPDMAFMTSCLRSDFFPPQDPWFAGEPINYFYFGHLSVASVTKLTGMPPNISFNLTIATLFAFTTLGAFAVAYHLTRRLSYAFFGPVFVTIMGNLDSIYQILFERDEYPEFNWWMPSRVIIKKVMKGGSLTTIDETINEFPFWSFLLGDLHAHLMAAPLMTLNILLILNLAQSRGVGLGIFGKKGQGVATFIVMGLTLGAVPITNFWEVPTFALLTAGAIFLSYYKSYGGWNSKILFGLTASSGGLLLAAGFFYLPYHWIFVPQASKVLAVPSEQRTIFGHFMAIYGFFLFMVFTYLISQALMKLRQPKQHYYFIAIGVLAVIAGAVSFYLMNFVVMLGLGTLFYLFLDQNKNRRALFAILLALIAFGQILGCEFIYIKDFYSAHLKRMNTIFKFYFQAWIFLGLACSYFTYWYITRKLKGRPKALQVPWLACFSILLALSLIYTVMGPYIKCGKFSAGTVQTHIPTLDGIGYMSWRFKDDYAAIEWFNNHIREGQPVILEATGEAFSHYSRISACTGLPTVLGWGNHESLWRDQSWQTILARTEEVKKLYNARTIEEIRPLLQKYKIQYIYVGNLEIERYEPEGLEKFKNFETVHDKDGGRIYKVG